MSQVRFNLFVSHTFAFISFIFFTTEEDVETSFLDKFYFIHHELCTLCIYRHVHFILSVFIIVFSHALATMWLPMLCIGHSFTLLIFHSSIHHPHVSMWLIRILTDHIIIPFYFSNKELSHLDNWNARSACMIPARHSRLFHTFRQWH